MKLSKKPKSLSYFWQKDFTGLPHFYAYTDWWSFSVVFCCRFWGFRVCYFSNSHMYHTLETGLAVWGKPSQHPNEYPDKYHGKFWRLNVDQKVLR
jgi:hypothetical protein